MKMKANKSSILLASTHAHTLSQRLFQPSIKGKGPTWSDLNSLSLRTLRNDPPYSQSLQLQVLTYFHDFKFPNAIKAVVADKNHCILSNGDFLTRLRKPLPLFANHCKHLSQALSFFAAIRTHSCIQYIENNHRRSNIQKHICHRFWNSPRNVQGVIFLLESYFVC